MAQVYVVAGDRGGAKDVIPVGLEFVRQGHIVTWFADMQGRGRDAFEQAGILYETRGPKPYDQPRVIVSATSSTAVSQQIAWTVFGEASDIPVVWIEDMYGCGEHEVTRVCAPAMMFVFDEIAAHIAHSVREDIPTIEVGKTSLAPFIEKISHRNEIRKKVWQALRLRAGEPLCVFWSGSDVDALRQHLAALTQFKTPAQMLPSRFAVRLHQTIAGIDREKALAAAACIPGVVAIDAHAIDADELVLASDYTISAWGGSQGLLSILASIPTCVLLFPDNREQMRRLGYPDALPPIVYSNSAVGCIDRGSLLAHLNTMMSYPQVAIDRVRMNKQAHSALMNAHATQQITEIISTNFL